MSEIKCIIGLEIHAQMKTKSKIFCSCPVGDAEPNTNVCETCLGYPGSKPRLNKRVFENGVKVAKALNCTIPRHVFFSRKSYFYPDMTKNFQITQYEIPVGLKGYVDIMWKGKKMKIHITRAHLEEDPGKLMHVGGDITNSKYTLIDYNRAGTPLIEIVTDPDFTNPEQVGAFLTKLRAILEHLDVYDTSLIMKADANISIEGGARVEVKNITGFHNIMKALQYEYSRQKIMAKQGRFITQQETRAFSEAGKITKKLRIKESEADYGYIFEPDLSWQNMNTKRLKKIYDDMNELPDERIARFKKEYKLTKDISYVLVYTDKALADFFEECAKKLKNKILLANWITTHLLKCLNYNSVNISKSKLSTNNFIEFMQLLESKKLSERLGKELIKDLVSSGKSIKQIMKSKKIKTISEKDIEKIVLKIIKNNPKSVSDYEGGNVKSLNYLLGQILRETKFQADINLVRKLLEKHL